MVQKGKGMWNPIETAPKDGTYIDLYDAVEFGRMADCYWGEKPHQCIDSYCDSCPSEEEAEAAWRESIFHEKVFFEPTHWMPIPPGPDVLQPAES